MSPRERRWQDPTPKNASGVIGDAPADALGDSLPNKQSLSSQKGKGGGSAEGPDTGSPLYTLIGHAYEIGLEKGFMRGYSDGFACATKLFKKSMKEGM